MAHWFYGASDVRRAVTEISIIDPEWEAGLLEFVSGGIVSLWLTMAGCTPLLSWTQFWPSLETPWQSVVGPGESEAEAMLTTYLNSLKRQGLENNQQGLWLQTGSQFLAMNQGSQPLPAASLTKVATSWAALQTWGVDHRFETVILTTGPINAGVLEGDLVIVGGGDPALVAEEAIALGNQLNQLGIRQVTGGLAIAGRFWVDFQADVKQSGETFKQLINAKVWSGEMEAIFQKLPPGTPRPQVAISGPIAVLPRSAIPIDLPRVLQHESLPLIQLLKLMNTYSSNFLAQSLASNLGGVGPVMAAATGAGVATEEIQLQNGSGLGTANQLSARAVCVLFAAIQHYLHLRHLSLADVFPVAGQDLGTLETRTMPKAAVVKTGTLNTVSALAGILPTRDRGLVWFAILNRGPNITGLRDQQDRFLQTLTQHWGKAPAPPLATLGFPTPPDQKAREDLVNAAVDFNSQQQ
jgi:serine-type D-Ala-D-Ala carboxypeptidase/endopeptidase (penicillin-binding protein 4)